MHLSMLRKGGGGMAYVGHLIDFCFPTLGEFGRNHLPKVGPRIFELSAILHPEEEHMRTGTNDFQAFHHKYVQMQCCCVCFRPDC